MAATTSVTVNTNSHFVPEEWSTKILMNLDDESLMLSKVNRDWESYVQGTDMVHIPELGQITVTRDVSADAVYDDDNPTDNSPTSTEKVLNLNKTTKASFVVQDTMEIQSPYSVADYYSNDLGRALAVDFDTYLLAQVGNAFIVTANAASGTAIAQADMNKTVVNFKSQYVPEGGRCIVVSPLIYGDLLDIDEFISSDYADAVGMVKAPQNNMVGVIHNIPVYVNNHTLKQAGARGASTATDPDTGAIGANAERGVAFHRDYLTFAMQKDLMVEAVRLEAHFATRYRALVVWGHVTLRPGFAQVIASIA